MKRVYEYVWDIKFTIPSRKISFNPYAFINMEKDCDYFNNFIPSYKLTCKISDRYVNILRLLDKELTAIIKVYMISGTKRDNYTSSELISEQEFACYYDKEQIPTTTQTNKTVSDELNKEDKLLFDDNASVVSQHQITMTLLLKKDLKMKTFIHNYIFGSEDKPVSPITAVTAIIEQNPYIDKYIIDSPDNNAVYSNLIVEAGELKDAIKNVQYNYGIFSKGLQLFYDDGILYVLNKCNNQHSYQKDEMNLITVKINERTDKPDANDFVIVGKDGIGYERRSKLMKEDYESVEGIYTGDKFVYSNYGSIINSGFGGDNGTTFVSPLNEVVKPRKSRVDVGVKKIVDYDMLNNPFNMSSTMYEKSIGVPVSFVLSAVNVKHFTPNKIIKLNFDTPESKKLYSGIYNIQHAIFVYKSVNNPGKRYNSFGSVLLQLCNKAEGFDKDYEPKE